MPGRNQDEAPTDADANGARGRWQRGVLAAALIISLSVWFSATAVGPSLQAEWGLGAMGLVWLTAAVQLGFVVGALAGSVFNLPDRVDLPLLIALAAVGAALCTLLFAFAANGFASAVVMRACTGVFLAGVYPTGMKLMATWSAPAIRGRSFGMFIACLTIGSTLPYLLATWHGPSWRVVMAAAAVLALLGAAITITCLRTGPYAAPSPPFNPRHVLVGFRSRAPRAANLGYFGHMWELYALWAWLPALVAISPQLTALPIASGLLVFLVLGVSGAVGSIIGGRIADRRGRRFAAVSALIVSGICCCLSPLVPVMPAVVALVVLVVWGAAVIADSGVFSAALSETVDSSYVGTSLAVQTAIGYGFTVISIQLVAAVADLGSWRVAFVILAIGPLIGAVAMSRFVEPREMGATA